MAGAIIGGLIGMFGVGGGFLFGATLWASIMTGMALGSLFDSASIDSNSPTYSFQGVQNTKTQLLPIPVVYGRCRVAGNIFYQAYLDDEKQKVNQMVGISEGPVQSISEVLAGDQDPTALEDCSVSIYLNSTNETVDSRNPTGAKPYPNDIAFVAVTLKAQEKLSGNPVITSIVEGRRIWTQQGVMFSRNPAWIVRDFLTNTRYGMGIPAALIDEASFATSADYCDELVAGGPRFTLDYVVDTQRPGVDHLQIMLSAFRGYLLCREKIELRIDAPVSVHSATVGLDQIIEGSFTWWQSADEDVLNRVIVEWVDPQNSWERTSTVFEDTVDITKRGVIEGNYSLLPISRPEQAARMGAYLLDSAAGIKNFCAFAVSLKDSDIEAGDVIAITHDLPGWTDKLFRVHKVADDSDDSIALTCSEYVPEIYNDRALDFPAHVDTNIPNSYECPDVVGLNATERVAVQTDGTLLSDIDIFWTDPPVLLRAVEILLLEQSGTSYQSCGTVAPGTQNFVIRGLKSNQSVIIKVRAIDTKGIKAVGATVNLVLYGKATPPGIPTNFEVIGGFQTMQIKWTNPGDADLDYVEIREAITSEFAAAYTIARVAGSVFSRTNLQTLRPYWYWIRAIDTSGNASAWVGPKSATTTAIVMEDFEEGIVDESAIVERVVQNIDANSLLEGVNTGAILEPFAEDLAETILGTALQNDEDYFQQGDDLAIATEELYTKIDEDVSAEAGKRLLLAATVDANVAAIQTEQTTRANADSALASNISTLGSSVAGNTAAIQTNAQAIAGVDGNVRAQYTIQTQAIGAKKAVAGIGLLADGQTGTSEFTVLADKFFVYNPSDGGIKPVFQIVGNQAWLDGDLIATGTIQGDKINATSQIQLADGGQLLIGEDGIVQIGNGAIVLDGASGLMISADPSNLATGDKLLISHGELQFLKYNNTTSAYSAYESIKAVATGTCDSNTWVTLPGAWKAPPDILVSPSMVMSFNSTYPTSDQYWSFYVSKVEEVVMGSGVWRFLPIAALRIGNKIAEQSVGYTRGFPNDVASLRQSVVTYTSSVQTTPANTREIMASGRVLTNAGEITDYDLYARDPRARYIVNVTLYYKLTSAGTYTKGQSVNMYFTNVGDFGAMKTWSLSALNLPAGTYHVYVVFTRTRQSDIRVPNYNFIINNAYVAFDTMLLETTPASNIMHGKLNWLAVAK